MNVNESERKKTDESDVLCLTKEKNETKKKEFERNKKNKGMNALEAKTVFKSK